MDAVALYRRQQLAIQSAIDAGQYDLASDLLRRDIRSFGIRDRMPQDEPSEDGHKTPSTMPHYRGIVKAIKRHICRKIKNYRRAKTMQNIFTLPDGCTIEIISLGRDDGAEIIGRNAYGTIVCYIATENSQTDRAEIVQTINGGAGTLEQVFDMWENGIGGNPFDLDYLPEQYR